MIEIKRNNKVFYTLEDVCEGSKMSRQLMDHHYIVLKFTTKEPVYFEIGDSVEIADFGYFELTSAYFPKFNEEMGGYDYELQMDAYYMAWKNKLCKYRPQYGANETSFKLTTTVGVHLKVILNNLKALGLKYNCNDFTADYTTYNKNVFDVQKRFYIEYGSISIIDALNAICGEDALDCEWWIDGSIIYLGYCEMVGQTTFEQGVNMVSMSQSESKSTFITRLYAFGSDKNIPTGYFTGSDVDVTTDGIATDYLMLPDKEVDEEGFYCKSGYIENVNVVKNDKQAIEGVVMFDDEYPKVNCKVSDIRTYDSTVENDDGTKTTETFWQVTSTDSFAMNFTTSWIKRNLTLMIKFTSGALLGMEFEVSFKIIGQRNYFEIVANENYGRKLPDADLCPKIGDEFFLYNWDATKITDTQLIPEAQEALYERAKTYYKKAMIDNSNFTCTMDGEKFFNHGTYDYHPLGEQVKLINPMFADTDKYGKHYRNSRIIGMEICLDIPYDSPQYIVGEKASYSRLGQLEDKVDSITVNGIQIGGVGSGGNGVYVIGMNDVTPASDSNVYSARRVNLSFLSKLYPDTAQELITFAKGLVSNVLAKLNGGMTIGEDGAGINELGEAVLESIRSLDYDNATETGFSITKDANGRYHQFITNLTIWGKAVFHELEVRKLSYAGGNIYLSGAGSKIVKVVPVVWDDESSEWHESSDELCEGWQCYLLADDGTTATQNQWKEGDQARCRTIGTLKSGTTTSSNKSYWRTIMEHGVSEANEKIYADDDTTELYGGQGFAWIVLGKHTEDLDGYTEATAPTETKDYPAEGDTIVLDGSRSDTYRQGVLIFESTGEGVPRIVGLHGISDYTHDGKSTYVLSHDGVEMRADQFHWITYDASGNPVKTDSMYESYYIEPSCSFAAFDTTGKVMSPSSVTFTAKHRMGNTIEALSGGIFKMVVGDHTCTSRGSLTIPNEVLSRDILVKVKNASVSYTATNGKTATLDFPILQDGAQGIQGPQGEKGDDAIHWELSPSTLTYSMDSKGNVTGLGKQNSVAIKVYKGSEDVTSNLTFAMQSNLDTYGCTAAKSNTRTFYISAIKTRTIEGGIVVPVTSGSFFVTFVYDGVTYRATANFQVDVSLYTGEMMLNNKQFGVTMQEVSNKADKLEQNSATKDELAQAKTELTQTAQKFAVEASENAIGRRNILGGTQFLRQSSYWAGNDTYKPRICAWQGFGGTNAVKVIGDSEHYQGLAFQQVAIGSARTYTVSVLVKKGTEISKPSQFILGVFQRTSYDAIVDNLTKYYVIDNASTAIGEWYQFTKTFTVADDVKWLDIVFALSTTDGTVYFCRPMLEEGDTFGGWTPSKLDYDYVGGNMLDDTRTLSPSSQQSNLEIYKSIAANTYEGAYAVAYGKADDSNANMDDFLRFSGENIRLLNFEKGKDYVLSFLARGSGQLNTYLYNNNHQNIFAENVDGDDWHSTGDGCTWVQLSSEWKRYWVHWRIEDYIGDGEEVLPKWVLFRAISGCEAWVTQPKLEEGVTPTDYTEKKTDLIDRTTAKQAGLEITADGVLLYGDKISVKNDGKTAAMFKDGSINADLINADTLNVHHVWAKDNENQNTLAHFGNYGIDEAKDTDGNQCPLWVGSSTASDAPFRVSKNGYMYANKGAFGVDYTENEGDDDETVRYGKFVIGDYDIHTGHEGASKCMSLSYEQLYFRNGTKRNFVYVGNNVGPVPGWGTSTNSAIRIDMLDGSAKDGNIAIHVDVENGPRNYAMIGTGDLSLNGFASGFKHTLIALPTANTIMMLDKGDISNTTCIITTSVSGAGITLPTLEAIQNMLGIGTDVKFCVRFTLVADIGTTTYSVYGRNDNRSGSAYPWNTSQLPIIFNWDGGYVSYFKMAAGDAYDFLLTYDPDKSYTVGSFTQPYVARIINRQV